MREMRAAGDVEVRFVMRINRIAPVIAAIGLTACSHNGASNSLPMLTEPSFGAPPSAATFKTIYSFKSLPDGNSPAAGLVVLGGTLYGTTQGGGNGGAGTVYATSVTGKERVLYSFGSGAPDGVFPVAGLTVLGGTFYGTTFSGGDHGLGAVFKVDKSGHEHVLYSFKGGKDGDAPSAALVVDKGALYGTTLDGGGSAKCPQGCGTVFEVTAAGKEHVVHAFKAGADGFAPAGNLIVVGSALYGTTANGGKNDGGTIFTISASGKEQILHSFGSGQDGSEPEAGLVDIGGKLYGTTNAGGKNFAGTVFAGSSTGGERVLYSFKNGSDGEGPEANLIALKGELYGTTAGGGAAGQGTVFAVTASGKERVLHAFKASEGSDPRAPLAEVNGALYGTTSTGGAGQLGTIFKVTP